MGPEGEGEGARAAVGAGQSRHLAAGLLQGHGAEGQRLLLGRVRVAEQHERTWERTAETGASRPAVCACASARVHVHAHVSAGSASQAEQDPGEAYFRILQAFIKDRRGYSCMSE